jgi:hypothetical protein
MSPHINEFGFIDYHKTAIMAFKITQMAVDSYMAHFTFSLKNREEPLNLIRSSIKINLEGNDDSLFMHKASRTCGGVEVQLRVFLNFEIHGGQWSASFYGLIPPRQIVTHSTSLFTPVPAV